MSGRFGNLGAGTGYYVTIVAPPRLFHDLDVKQPRSPHRKAPIAARPK